MLEADSFLRCGTLTLAMLITIVLLKNHQRDPSSLFGSLFVFGGGWDQMLPLLARWDWVAIVGPLHLLSLATLWAFWLLAKSLFDDQFRWSWHYLLVYAALVVLSLIGHQLSFGDAFGAKHWILRTEVAFNGFALLPLMFMVATLPLLALYAALKDWRVDLVESRRRARVMFVLVVGGLILLVSFAEYATLGTPRSGLADSLGAAISFFLLLGFAGWSFGFRWGQVAQPQPLRFPSETAAQMDAEATGEGGESIVHQLERLMSEEHLYCEEGLTISQLAERLQVKEYRLRRLINGHLDYRNFNQFLNRYRIEEASRQLAAPEKRHLPVLSIAFDVGYGSLAPFNKAFKEAHGITPSEFRTRRSGAA